MPGAHAETPADAGVFSSRRVRPTGAPTPARRLTVGQPPLGCDRATADLGSIVRPRQPGRLGEACVPGDVPLARAPLPGDDRPDGLGGQADDRGYRSQAAPGLVREQDLAVEPLPRLSVSPRSLGEVAVTIFPNLTPSAPSTTPG
jgi:hypothetical protein